MVHVLLIEDNEQVRASLESALTSMGHTVKTAINGREGVEVFKLSHFDLVITDLIMPEKDGVETILELKVVQPDLKIIAISGDKKNLDVMDTTYEIGATCALTKPFSMRDLETCVDRVLAKSAD
ncbi:MAG: response regulator [Magnetovibrio sp.]|nr:response regulator [Magnetovibrio sp.]